MYLKLLSFELKSFFRNPQFAGKLVLKILMAFGFIWLGLTFVGLAAGSFYFIKDKMQQDPLLVFSSFFLYYAVLDLLVRYFMQPMPTQNIKPFLTQNIRRSTLVNYTILKIFFHFFNWGYLLFVIPFAVLLIADGVYSIPGVLMFSVGIMFVFYFNNFLNILLNKKDKVLYAVAAVVIALGAADYYGYIPLSAWSGKIFYALYSVPGAFLIPVILAGVVAYLAYRNILENFYLDRGLEMEKEVGRTENIAFLNRFGVLGTFINNDIRLLRRSKAAKSTLSAAAMFLLYGLLMYTSEIYNTDAMRMFMGLFVTGGFLFMFGQRVPAWDSSYYSLMMTQNVPYNEYLKAKWSLVVIVVFASMILAVFYVFISWELYVAIFAAGLYNLGVNSYLTLLAGAYNRQSIDLNARAKSFGGSNNMNMKALLIMIPQLLVPMAVYGIVKYLAGIYAAVAVVGVLGIVGFLLRDRIFRYIATLYQTRKYGTLEAFKKI